MLGNCKSLLSFIFEFEFPMNDCFRLSTNVDNQNTLYKEGKLITQVTSKSGTVNIRGDSVFSWRSPHPPFK